MQKFVQIILLQWIFAFPYLEIIVKGTSCNSYKSIFFAVA